MAAAKRSRSKEGDPGVLDDAPPAEADPQRPTPELLLWAYRRGVFPMADPRSPCGQPEGRIDWYFPDPRGVLPLHPPQAFHVPKNVARELRRRRFEIRCDTAFEQVMRACATARSPDNLNWINEPMIAAYAGLHAIGHAHSIEAWREGKLVGGLYGVHIGGAFFGESMFTRSDLGGSNASKICLVHLVHHLQLRGFTLLDTQMVTPHMKQFGCIEIAAHEYLNMLSRAITQPITWGEF